MPMVGLEDLHHGVYEGHHTLNILHEVDLKGSMFWAKGPFWEIDGAKCILAPPKSRFHDLPKEVIMIKAQFAYEPDDDRLHQKYIFC